MDDDRRRVLADRVAFAREQGPSLDPDGARWCRHYAEDVGELLAAPPPHARMTADDALRNLAAERLKLLEQCQRERDDMTEYATQLERQLAAEAT